jgi:hypothetical protein
MEHPCDGRIAPVAGGFQEIPNRRVWYKLCAKGGNSLNSSGLILELRPLVHQRGQSLRVGARV